MPLTKFKMCAIIKLRNATERGEKMVNTDKIKGRMREMRLTQNVVAKRLGINQATANQKINNTRCFTLKEAEQLSDLLELTDEEFKVYFFAK